MKYNLTINGQYTFPLFFWDTSVFLGSGQLDIATDDFVGLKNKLNTIESLQITDTNDLEVAYYTNYNKYDSISYIGGNYSPQQEKFCDEILVNLVKSSLEQKIADLETQVEDLQRQIDELKPTDPIFEENVNSGDANEDATAALNEEPDSDSDVEEPNDDAETEILEDAEQIESEYDEPTE